MFVCWVSQRSPPVSLAHSLGFFRPQQRFSALVGQHQDAVYGLALYLTRDADAAADVAQEAFVRLWTHRETVEADRAGAWLMRVTRNLAIDHLRARKRARCDADAEPDATPDLAPLPDVHAEQQADLADAHAALDTLREPFRSLLVLRELQDLSYDEIGEALDLPLTSVKVYLHRARKMLRAAYLEQTRAYA